jgi:hypothetical protein
MAAAVFSAILEGSMTSGVIPYTTLYVTVYFLASRALADSWF